MKTWRDWLSLWEGVSTEVPCPLFTRSTEWAVMVTAVEAAEERLRPAVDAACRSWIRTGAWPRRMSGPVQWFAMWRVAKARQVAILLSIPGPWGLPLAPATLRTEAELKHWFLIDVWPWGWSQLSAELRNAPDAVQKRFCPGEH